MAANYGLNILISARNTASGAINTLGQGLKGLMGAVLNLKTALAGVGGVLAGAFAFGKIVSAGADLEQQLARLEGLVKATGGTAGVSAREINAFAEALDKATLGNAAAIRDAAGELLTFKNVSKDTFFTALRLGQDLAEVFGTDVKQATLQIGKALEDPIQGMTALRRVGVSFTEAQQAQIKALEASNDLLGAQGIILEALAGQVGGAAEAAASGLAGAMDTAAFEFNKLLETLGEIFKPAVTAGFQQLAGLVTQLRDKVLELNAEGGIADFAKLVVDNLTRAGEAFVKFVGSLDTKAIDQGLRQIQSALNDILAVLGFFVNTFKYAFNSVQVAAGNATAIVFDVFAQLASEVKRVVGVFGLFSDAAQRAADTLGHHVTAMKDTAAALREDVKKNTLEAVDALKGLASGGLAARDATAKLTSETGELGTATKATTKAVDEFTSGLKTNTAAKEDATAKTEALTAAEKQYGKEVAAELKRIGVTTRAEVEESIAELETLFTKMQATGNASADDLAAVFSKLAAKVMENNAHATQGQQELTRAMLAHMAHTHNMVGLLDKETRALLGLQTAAEKRAAADRSANQAQQRYTQDTLDLLDKLGIKSQRQLEATAASSRQLFETLSVDGNAAINDVIAAYEKWAEAEIAAAEHATDAEKARIQETFKAAAARAGIVDKLDEEIKRVIGLGEAAEDMGARAAQALDEVTEATGRLGVAARNAEFSMKHMGEESNSIAQGARVVTREYGRQLEEVKDIYERLGRINLDTAEGMRELNRLSRLSINQFDQLGSNQLDPLRDAIEDAKRQMMSFRDQTEAALFETREELEDMKAEGDRLKQEELSFQRERAEALRQYEMARAARDREAIANTRERIKLLTEIHERRLKEIAGELAAEKELQTTQARRAIEDLEASGDERRAAVLQYERERAEIEAELTRYTAAGEGQMIRLARERLTLLDAAHEKRLSELDAELAAARAVNAEREKATGDPKPAPKRGGVAAFPRGGPPREVTMMFKRPDGTVAGRGQFDAQDAKGVEQLLGELAAAQSTSSFR